MSYEWIKNGPSSTTFFEPRELSKEFKESLYYLGLLYRQALKEKATPVTETPTPAKPPKTRKP